MIHCIFASTGTTMFRRKKSSESGLVAPAERRPVLRGRDAAAPAAGPADNPLARRFRPEREPATIDLTAPARFQLPSAADGDPHTAAPQTDLPQLARVVSRDPQTGKFYVHPGHPGGDQSPVLLQGEPVRAPTELRPGDTIRAGDVEFRFLPRVP
jgi:hypothetical protein